MESVLLALAGWLETVGLRQWANATPWVYPLANVLHVVGVVLLIGGIGVVDLRVAGLWRRLPLVALSRALTPIAVHAADILGGQEQASRWLHTQNRALGGQTPLDLLDTDLGSRQVEDVLGD